MKNWEGDFITACYLSNDKQLFHLLLVVLLTLITLQGNSQCVYNYGSTLNLTNNTIHRDLVKWRIPIVFHVLHNKEVENISDSLIIIQIKYLNGIYDNRNIIFINSDFLLSNPKLEFTINNNENNAVSSIRATRTRTLINTFNTGDYLFQNDPPKYTHLGGNDSWNTDSFLNVWVCELNSADSITESLAGYAYHPTLVNDWDYTSFVSPERQGVVINYRCFLDSQSLLSDKKVKKKSALLTS